MAMTCPSLTLGYSKDWVTILDQMDQSGLNYGKRTNLPLMSLRGFIEEYNEELEEYYDEDFGTGFLCKESCMSGDYIVLCLVDRGDPGRARAEIPKDVRQKIKKAGKFRRNRLKHQWTYNNPMNRIVGYVILTNVTSEMTPEGKMVMSIPLVCSSYYTCFRGVGSDLMDLTKEFCSLLGYTDIVLEVSNEWSAMAELPEDLQESVEDEDEDESGDEDYMEEDDGMVECDSCGRSWDGNAQCPCGMDEEDEDEVWYPDDEVHKLIANELWKKCLRKDQDSPYHSIDEPYVYGYLQSYLFEEEHSTSGKKIKPVPEENSPKDYEYGGVWYKKGVQEASRLIDFYKKFGFKEDMDVYLNWGCFSDHPYPSMVLALD